MRIWIRATGVRLVLFSVLWWAISEGESSMAPYGVVAVLAATATSVWLLAPGRPLLGRTPAAARLLWWFLRQSVLGGVDVARRTMSKRVDVDPGTVDVEISVSNPIARVLLADISALTPGSLAVDLLEHGVRVHMLHNELPVQERIAELDALLCALFEPDHDDPSPTNRKRYPPDE